MTKTVAIKAMAGVEHAQAKGRFAAYLPMRAAPTAIRAGDRLRVRLEVPDQAWIYAVAAIGQREYWALGIWPPGKQDTPGVRMLWPGGRVLTSDDATMMTLFMVASSVELAWARDLAHSDCSSLIGQMPPDPPATPCDHLYGLFWKVPMRPRGLVPPKVEFFREGGIQIPAITVAHSGAPYTAVEWQFMSRD